MIYIACEEIDFIWTKKEVLEIEKLWREGYDIRVIAEIVKRDCDEVSLLIFDRAKKGKIRPISTGIFGKLKSEGEQCELKKSKH